MVGTCNSKLRCFAPNDLVFVTPLFDPNIPLIRPPCARFFVAVKRANVEFGVEFTKGIFDGHRVDEERNPKSVEME